MELDTPNLCYVCRYPNIHLYTCKDCGNLHCEQCSSPTDIWQCKLCYKDELERSKERSPDWSNFE